MRICLQNRNHDPHPIDYRDEICDGVYTSEFLYIVHYPVREDSVIQYKDMVFRSNASAYAFASEHGATVRRVEVRD